MSSREPFDNSDWLSRINLADVYHRKEDPFRPQNGVTPASAPGPSLAGAQLQFGQEGSETLGSDIYSRWLTVPGTRPTVNQRAYNISFSVTATPQPIMNQQFSADTFIIDVPSTETNSIFFGFGNSINTLSGIEVQPGLPIAITPENTREQWEIQRLLEAIAAMLAAERGWNPIGQYRAPRVVFNANEYYLVAAAGVTVAASVMVFTVPEMQ